MTFERQPGARNEVLNGDGFYVSYNARTGADGLSALIGLVAASMIGNDAMAEPAEETALCVDHPGGRPEWLILNGDFRKDYEGIAPLGLSACLEFYRSQKDSAKSPWSTERERA